MANVKQIMSYLDKNGISYQVRTHMPAFSTHEAAAATNVPEREVAKTIVVRAGKHKWMVVLQADQLIDCRRLGKLLEAHDIQVVPDEELRSLFPNCEIGAIPPLGNLYGLPVLVDRSLADENEIVFYASTFTETVRIKFKNFVRLVKPTIADIAMGEVVCRGETVEEAR